MVFKKFRVLSIGFKEPRFPDHTITENPYLRRFGNFFSLVPILNRLTHSAPGRTICNHMKILPFLSVVTLTTLSQISVKAHDNHFLPGDAFFSVSFTRDSLHFWIENEPQTFDLKYARFDGKHTTDGSLGYSKLQIQDINDAFRTTVTKAYWRFTALQRPLFRLESDDQEVFTQTNGVVALIYSKGFQGTPGLKYNENWQIEGLRNYAGLFTKAGPVIEDWSKGPEVLPLKLANPVPPLAHIPMEDEAKRSMTAPVMVKAIDIKILFVGFTEQKEGFESTQTCPNLQKIYDNVPGTEYMVIDSEGFTKFSCNSNGKWEQKHTETN